VYKSYAKAEDRILVIEAVDFELFKLAELDGGQRRPPTRVAMSETIVKDIEGGRERRRNSFGPLASSHYPFVVTAVETEGKNFRVLEGGPLTKALNQEARTLDERDRLRGGELRTALVPGDGDDSLDA
jgi:hypothetical protein